MRKTLRALFFCAVAPAAAALAAGDPPAAPATPEANPTSGFNKVAFGQMKAWMLQSAEKMPAESFGYRPVETVRSFGQILGHVADAQYLFCAAVLVEKSPAPQIEKTRSSKAEVVAALKDAFAYCDRAHDGMTDAAGLQTVKFIWGDMPKLTILTTNNMHMVEHYGNLVTYLRMKGIVPPSSEQPIRPEQKK